MAHVLFHISNLTVGYRDGLKDKILFEDLTLELRAGELVCFMGANGVGKSTLIRTLAGLFPPLSENKRKVDPKTISVVLTDRVYTNPMTARELVSYGRYPHINTPHIHLSDGDKNIVESMLRCFHLESISDRDINELSDGQLQMVMIARAFAQDTPVILMDEPTAHLDLNNRVEIMSILQKYSRELNKAILVATHELDLALQMADWLWLADKKAILKGIPEDVVLNGCLDQVFQFKGYDLRTGKVEREIYRKTKIRIRGEGYRYLWTKNAVERSGYEVCDTGVEIFVAPTHWTMNSAEYRNLEELLNMLNNSNGGVSV